MHCIKVALCFTYIPASGSVTYIPASVDSILLRLMCESCKFLVNRCLPPECNGRQGASDHERRVPTSTLAEPLECKLSWCWGCIRAQPWRPPPMLERSCVARPRRKIRQTHAVCVRL